MNMSRTLKKSTDQDLSFILDWLQQEHAENEEGEGFWNNRDIISNTHASGDMHVLVDEGEVVAFFCGPVRGPDILEVRPDMRCRGYGRMAAEKCIEIARSSDVCVMQIECQPSSSIPFWKKMGFELFEGRVGSYGSRYAYLVLNRRHELPEGTHRQVLIEFLPERVKYESGVLPFSSVSLTGIEDRSGVIHLPERAICFSPSMEKNSDPLVRLTLDGKEIHFDKAKYKESRDICISRGPCYTFYVDRIRPR